jgi:transcriptional regulator with PAS, ATPase and Fis domain
MIELFKDRLHELLKQKDVSLAMLYDKDGNILWHKGRQIEGRNIKNGKGFCRSIIQESIRSRKEIFKDNVHLTCDPPESDSARRLLIKSIVIYPLVDDFFMYIDSGIRMAFTDVEHGMIRMLITMFKDSIQQIRRSETASGGIAGESPAIERIKELVLKYSIEEDCVLLTGETGVGKTHIAELIHRFSGRKGKFVVVETTAISESLFESEIFGHKKGAFTGAVESKRGLTDEADGGTLFFDEISEIPISFQAKLLRFIEFKKYRVLGDPTEREADVKILAASNKDLHQMISGRQFRQDLFYRLSVLNIHIPPLRERREDFRPIILSGKKYLKGKAIGDGFWEAVLEYPWPGNVRELFSVMKRAGILCDSPITGRQIKNLIYEDIRQSSNIQAQCQVESIWELFKAGRNFWEVVGEPFLKRELTRSQVKDLVDKALTLSGGKYIQTLKLFNLPSSQYKRFMKFLNKHQLQ